MKAKKIESNGEVVSFIDNEKGDNALLFLHGAFINKEYWIHQLAYFAAKYRVIAIDLPGHGHSTQHRTEWTCLNFGKDVNAFIKALSLKNVVLIGHSFASDVMLETVHLDDSQIVGLVEVDHMKNVGTRLPQETIKVLTQGIKEDFEGFCEQYARQALVTPETAPELVDKLLQDYRNMPREVGIPLILNGFEYTDREVALLRSIHQKLHLIHVNYTASQEENLKNCLGENYSLHRISGTCHYPMLENPDQFNKILEKVLLEIAKDHLN